MLLSYKPLHLEAQQRLQEEGCVVDISISHQEFNSYLGRAQNVDDVHDTFVARIYEEVIDRR